MVSPGCEPSRPNKADLSSPRILNRLIEQGACCASVKDDEMPNPRGILHDNINDPGIVVSGTPFSAK